jgi:1-phosphatidylinositol-3-phosphate 5-kinase
MDDNLMELTRGRPFPLKQRARTLLHKAVTNDTLFLSIVNIVDYSILVGLDEEGKLVVAGIIDFLRQYDIIKRMERMGKSVGMIAGQAEPTIVQPTQYKKRFQAAMDRYFMSTPDKWSVTRGPSTRGGGKTSAATDPDDDSIGF